MQLTSSLPAEGSRGALIAGPEEGASRPVPLRNVAFNLVLLFSFLLFSRAPELFHIRGRVVLLLSLVAGLVNILNGNFFRAIFSVPGKLLFAFTGWMLLTTATGIWHGGSVMTLREQWQTALLCFLLIASSVADLAQCRKIMYSLAGSVLIIGIASFVLGKMAQGRLQMGQGGTLGNANELAFFLLLGLPFCYLWLQNAGRKVLPRVFALGAMLLILVNALRTGSRSGMVCALALLIGLFIRTSMIGRLRIVIGLLIVIPLGIALSPHSALDRYKTLFASDVSQGDTEAEDSAILSKQLRQRLLVQSLYVTLHHPLVGVGPGNFPNVQSDDPHWVNWKVTHNSYTQISSENGIPGFLLYCSVIVWCMHSLRNLYRYSKRDPALKQVNDMSYCMILALICFIIAATFDSMGYGFHLPVLAALTLTLERCARQEQPSVAPPPPVVPAVCRPRVRPLRPVMPRSLASV